MLTRIQSTTGVITVVLVIFTLVYRQTSSNHKSSSIPNTASLEYSQQLDGFRQDIHDLKKKVYQIEQTLSSSTLSNPLFSWIRRVFSNLTCLSSSFFVYTFFLYLFHLCVSHSSTTQTIKLVHIVNILSYTVMSSFYTSLKHLHYSNLAWLLFVLLFKTQLTMSCPMFMYGLAAGSLVPLSVVYVMRPESLTNLFDLISSSLLIAFNWSEGVAQRFNLSTDLFFNSELNGTLPVKMYSCYTIEYWYNTFSYIIYVCFALSLIIFLFHQRLKTSEEFLVDDAGERQQSDETSLGIDFVFVYFCVFILAMISIFSRILIEYYLLGYLKAFTIVYLLWYMISFAVVWLWNR